VHSRKAGDREFTADDARGASALVNAARFVRLLVPMSADEETKAGLNSGDRFRFFKVINGKSNLTPRSDRAQWRQIVSQQVGTFGSGKRFWQVPDDVGVVTKWTWPSPADVLEGTPTDALDTIKATIRAGEYRAHELAETWAGLVVADVLELDASDKPTKQRIKAMLAAWIGAGHFKTVLRRDPVKREDKKYLIVTDKTTAPV
jgi:hypothetical protein